MADSDSEQEDLVMVEFAEPVPSCFDSSKIKIVGLDSDAPIVQYEKQVFKGEWTECLGTKLIFSEKENMETWDPAFSPQVPKQFECLRSTRKILRLQSVVLTAKDTGQALDDDDEDDSEEDASDANEAGDKGVNNESLTQDSTQPGASSST